MVFAPTEQMDKASVALGKIGSNQWIDEWSENNKLPAVKVKIRNRLVTSVIVTVTFSSKVTFFHVPTMYQVKFNFNINLIIQKTIELPTVAHFVFLVWHCDIPVRRQLIVSPSLHVHHQTRPSPEVQGRCHVPCRFSRKR